MGRPLGAFDSEELDRPDLNKCPDCECFFQTETCPLCGKICPEEMRAGNRKPPKKAKKRGNSTGRVQFIPWYHTWPFIVIMMFLMPVVGVILFFTSPHSRKAKIIGASVGIAYFVFIYMGVGWMLIDRLWQDPSLVNTELSREAYVETCEEVDAEQFFRYGEGAGTYMTMELLVKERWVFVYDGYDVTDDVYYLCVDPQDDSFQVLVLDCQIAEGINLRAGDLIRAYGENGGVTTVYPEDGRQIEGPCLYMAYVDLME